MPVLAASRSKAPGRAKTKRKTLQRPAARNLSVDRLQRFSVEQYHRMIASGVLTENDPVELLEGLLVAKMPRDPHHDGSLCRVQKGISALLTDTWVLRIQSAITTRESEPEPDLVIATGPDTKYFNYHPRRGDLALVIEVANTSLGEDRDLKGPIYARERIPIYWIVNLIERQVEVYTQPRGVKSATYRERRDYLATSKIPVVLGGEEIGLLSVADFLPPAV